MKCAIALIPATMVENVDMFNVLAISSYFYRNSMKFMIHSTKFYCFFQYFVYFVHWSHNGHGPNTSTFLTLIEILWIFRIFPKFRTFSQISPWLFLRFLDFVYPFRYMNQISEIVSKFDQHLHKNCLKNVSKFSKIDQMYSLSSHVVQWSPVG